MPYRALLLCLSFLCLQAGTPQFQKVGKGPGVLLIHGFFCNRQLWRPLARWLTARGHPLGALDLEPVLGSIDDYVPAIERAVTELLARTGAPAVALVGHSMGGLAARAYLRRHGSARISALVT